LEWSEKSLIFLNPINVLMEFFLKLKGAFFCF
jgi:hypothetical protein